MNGALLRFYVPEGQRHHGKLVWEWLLRTAADLGVRGGSAFRAVAGFGRHHVLHEQNFFELAGTLAMEVEFLVTDTEAEELLKRLGDSGIRLFYSRTPAQFEVLNPGVGEKP